MRIINPSAWEALQQAQARFILLDFRPESPVVQVTCDWIPKGSVTRSEFQQLIPKLSALYTVKPMGNETLFLAKKEPTYAS